MFSNTLLEMLISDVWDDVLIGAVTAVTVGFGTDMLADVEVTVLVAMVTTLEFVVSLLFIVDDALADVWVDTSIAVNVLIGARVDFGIDVMLDT